MHRFAWIKLLIILCLIIGNSLEVNAEERYSTNDLLGMSLEELMNTKVISVSKREENYYDVAAAVFVITNEDIRRAGARSIPEALRLAPGVEVARVNSNQYAIAIRGQNDLFSDKLLVLMDGRTLYTPTTSGVFWLTQNYPMNDIERIEVIRGPSGAIWGANAVNGVINIITRNAYQTTNTHLTVGGGIEERGFANLRVGGERGNVAYRGYAMSEERDGGIYPVESDQSAPFPAGKGAPDSRRFDQGGFRADWIFSEQTDISVHGDIFNVRNGAFGTYVPQPFVAAQQPYISKDHYSGHNLVAKINHRMPDQSSISGQLFYDQYQFETISYGERRDTFDIDLQYNSRRIMSNLISVGGNFRSSISKIKSKSTVQMPDDSMTSTSFFLNDDIELIKDRLHLIIGSKFEKSSYMGWQNQPQIRAIYTGDSFSLWASAAKAVRSPNKAEASVTANIASGFHAGLGSNYVGRGVGAGLVKPEVVRSYEAGIRIHPTDQFLMQLALFRINYRGISDLNTQLPANIYFTPQGAVVPYYYKNVLDGSSNGFELDTTFKVNEYLKLKGTYSYLHQFYEPVDALTGDPEALATVKSTLKQSPAIRYSFGVSIDPTESLELDMNLYGWSLYRNDTFGPVNPATGNKRSVNSYTRLDARVAWQATESITITLAGQNLLKAAHREDVDSALEFSSLIQQSFFAKIDYNY